MTDQVPNGTGASPPGLTDDPAAPGSDPGEIGSAARSCLVILGLLLALALIACVALVVRPLVDGG